MDTMESTLEQLHTAGVDVMNLAVEDMVFPAPSEAIDLASQYMDERGAYYTRSEGHPVLRKALLSWLAENGHIYADNELIVGAGSRSLFYFALSAMSRRCKEAILFAPFPPEYQAIIRMAGMVPRVVSLPSPFKITIADLQKELSSDPQVICIQSPAQPSGMTVDQYVLQWIFEHAPDVYVIWDGLFSGLSYGNRPDSMPLVSGTGNQRLMMLGSFSMSFAMSGWRIGYGCGPKSIVSEMVSKQSSLVLQPPAFLQRAAAYALEHDDEIHTSLKRDLIERKKYVVHQLLQVKGISFWPPEAGFYLFLSVEQLLSETYPDALAWCIGLLEREHVALVPGDQFGVPGFARLTFAVEQDLLKAAVSGISRFADHCSALKEQRPHHTTPAYLQPPASH